MHDESLLIPLGAFAVVAVAIISGAVSNIHQKRLKADQRMTMLQRGMPVPDIERLLGTKDELDARDPLRRMNNIRLTAIILISFGLGAIFFFVVLTYIVHEHDVLSGAAAALVPLAIGIGFLIDYRLQARDIARLGLDLPGTRDRTR